MRYTLSKYIEADLQSIADYIALDNPTRSYTFVEEIEAKFITLSQILGSTSFVLTSDQTLALV